MKVVTWNINGVRARLDGLITWLRDAAPDCVCLQEIKTIDEGFPRLEIESLGYNVAVYGQKGFNGVAILSKSPLEDVMRGLLGDPDDSQARYIEATVSGEGRALRLCGLYLPNGNPIGGEKFGYKLDWMRRLIERAETLRAEETPFVLLGDFNVIPEPIDAKTPDAWRSDALFQPESRALFAELCHLGLTDALRACQPGPGVYTFWDYQAGAYQKNNGIRIDHILLSPTAADRMVAAGTDAFTRGWEKPSDHCPVWVELAI